MTGNISACRRGFQDPVIACVFKGSGIVFCGSLGPFRDEELLCDYHQLLVKSLSPINREDSSKQL